MKKTLQVRIATSTKFNDVESPREDNVQSTLLYFKNFEAACQAYNNTTPVPAASPFPVAL